MSKRNTYELILDKYSEDLDTWRILLYESMGKLMRKNPLLRLKNNTYTKEDIWSEAFLIADDIILREDIPEYKKIAKLWYLFNKGGWALYNKITQYSAESYSIEDINQTEDISAYMDDEILSWILIRNNVITPVEEKVLTYLKEWRWKYEIARLMKTTYYNIKSIIDWLTVKIERFLEENDINDADNR